MLRSVPLFRGWSGAAINCVARVAHGRAYSAGQMVFRAGDPSDALLVVVAGRIAISLLSPDGAEVLLNIIEPVEVVGEIGLIDGGPRTASATVVRDTQVLLLGRRDFLSILESEPSATRSMLVLLCSRLRHTTAFLEDAMLEALPIRLLHRIQTLARRYGQCETGRSVLRIEHGLSQQELGDSIGASRVSVNQLLNAWRVQGVLDFGRGFIVVHDMGLLEAAVRDR